MVAHEDLPLLGHRDIRKRRSAADHHAHGVTAGVGIDAKEGVTCHVPRSDTLECPGSDIRIMLRHARLRMSEPKDVPGSVLPSVAFGSKADINRRDPWARSKVTRTGLLAMALDPGFA